VAHAHPAYDIAPGLPSGDTSAQAMALTRDGRRTSRLALCRESARDYLLDPDQANRVIDEVMTGIETHFEETAELARLTGTDRDRSANWSCTPRSTTPSRRRRPP
jgi:serine/threonine-protein kinase HipA